MLGASWGGWHRTTSLSSAACCCAWCAFGSTWGSWRMRFRTRSARSRARHERRGPPRSRHPARGRGPDIVPRPTPARPVRSPGAGARPEDSPRAIGMCLDPVEPTIGRARAYPAQCAARFRGGRLRLRAPGVAGRSGSARAVSRLGKRRAALRFDLGKIQRRRRPALDPLPPSPAKLLDLARTSSLVSLPKTQRLPDDLARRRVLPARHRLAHRSRHLWRQRDAELLHVLQDSPPLLPKAA